MDATTDIAINSFTLPFISIAAPDYTVNIASGAKMINSNSGGLFTLEAGHTNFNIAGELSGGDYRVIAANVAGAPSWSINLTGSVINTHFNSLFLGQGGNDSLTLESGSTLASGGGSVTLRGGTDTVTFNGGTMNNVNGFRFEDGDDQLQLNFAPSSTTRFLGGSGTDTVTLTNNGSYTLDTLESGWEVLTMNGSSWTLTGTTTNTFNDAINLNSGNLTLSNTADITIAGALTGAGTLTKSGGHTLFLTGSSTHTGLIDIQSGQLTVNGSTTSNIQISATARLAGGGSLGSAQMNGTLAPGNSPETLTVNGDLDLTSTSVLEFELDTSGTIGSSVNDLVEVNGNLTLNGTLNITDLGNYGLGTYRLINYTGSLSDNGLTIGTQPNGFSGSIDTSTAGQVNLIVSALGTNTSGNVHALPAIGIPGLALLIFTLILTGLTAVRHGKLTR
ncbi:hypothetical protein [Gilvimarinus sp. 1_MG-2023]|uniref:hypothetical protein n=1 Tax=Gilvimarinus sp. 1_MG-2023 TaxID=3062638 RepID=UPI0026E1F6C5|nr:hypothetical protein [Gilvimarinus sp. 1_MG-2023]MDO6746174.1 hypothetical protein [Gilvimarinus sp. 1_MG-2023]